MPPYRGVYPGVRGVYRVCTGWLPSLGERERTLRREGAFLPKEERENSAQRGARSP